MTFANDKMFELLRKRINIENQLVEEFVQLINEGFVFIEECYFLKKLLSHKKHVSAANFCDKTAFECFVNSIHIDDYAASSFFEQAILFADALKDQWKKNYSINAEIILSETDYGYNVKIHALRPGEEWINIAELDSFEEAVLVYHI